MWSLSSFPRRHDLDGSTMSWHVLRASRPRSILKAKVSRLARVSSMGHFFKLSSIMVWIT